MLSAAPLAGEQHLRVLIEVHAELLRLVELDAEKRHRAQQKRAARV